MKKNYQWITVFILALGIITFLGFKSPTSETNETLIIRTFEGMGWDSYLIVLKDDIVIETIELGNPKKDQVNNSKLLSKKLNELLEKGYQLKHMSSAGEIAQGAIIGTYILQK